MEYAIQLFLSIVMGIVVGHWLDIHTGKGPWFTLAGLFVGIILGIGALVKAAMVHSPTTPTKDDKSKSSDPD